MPGNQSVGVGVLAVAAPPKIDQFWTSVVTIATAIVENRRMATPNQPQLSDSQLAELEKLARAEERSVDEVLSEAVDRLYQG